MSRNNNVERNARICELLRVGRTSTEVAQQFGLSRQNVWMIGKGAGIAPPRGRPKKSAAKASTPMNSP